jgi:hypothetical protein
LSAASVSPLADGKPVSVGTAPAFDKAGCDWGARPVEMAEDASSVPSEKKSGIKPPRPSLDEAAPATVTLGAAGAARVGVTVSSLSSSGSAASGLRGSAAGREAAGAGAAAGAAALGAGDRERSAIWFAGY